MAVRGGLPFDWWLRRGGARCERGEKEGGEMEEDEGEKGSGGAVFRICSR